MHPETLLHIYYFQGRLERRPPLICDYFLGNWEEDGFSFLFFSREVPSLIAQIQKDHPRLQLIDTYQMSYEQWQGGLLTPQRIGRFLLTPPWAEESAADTHTKRLLLDPGLVFGNGTHPTTRDCLEALDIACADNSSTHVLDLGTGTGVLALAAATLGCTKVLAVDFNGLAATTAANNVRLNQREDNILVVHGRAEDYVHIPSDILIANIHYAIMKELIAAPGFLQQKWFILSGLLTSEAELISQSLSQLPVTIVRHWSQDNIWHTFLGISTPS